MNNTDWFVLLVAGVVGATGWPWSQRIAWAIVGLLALARLLQLN